MDLEAPTPAPPPDAPGDGAVPDDDADERDLALDDEDLLEPPLLPYVSWPPPGLERLQGDLWRVTAELGAGGIVFTLPLLVSAVTRQDFWSLGLFGEAWWILLVTSVVGLAVLARGFVELVRLLRRWARATERGYRVATVALVLGDRRRDAGFLLQGARSYSRIGTARRARILRARLFSGTLLFAASLWLSVGFALGVVLAARGVLGPTALAWWTLGPAGVAIVVAVVLRLWESMHLWRARREWFGQPWSEDLEQGEIAQWHESLARRQGAVYVPPGGSGRSLGLRVGAGVSALMGLGVAAVGIVLMGMAGIGPSLMDIAVPRFSVVAERAVRAEAATEYRLPADPAITPLAAGQALVSLGEVGTTRERDPVEQAPVRTYSMPFFVRGEDEPVGGPTGIQPVEWASELVPRLAGGLEPGVLDYLEEVGSHPALAELRTLAHAGALDEAGATVATPLPADVNVFSLPIPRISGLRDAAFAQVGGAVAAAARGQEEDAVTRLREVISAGLLLGEEGTTLMTNLIGYVLVNTGTEALVNLYEVTGRPQEARALRDELETTEQVTEMLRVGGGFSPSGVLRGMPDMVVHPDAIRGLRWAYFTMLNGLGPCLNLNRSIFGTDDAHDRWVAEAREILVRYPNDEEVYALARAGFFRQTGTTDLGVPGRLAALVLGDPVAGGCAEAFVQTVR